MGVYVQIQQSSEGICVISARYLFIVVHLIFTTIPSTVVDDLCWCHTRFTEPGRFLLASRPLSLIKRGQFFVDSAGGKRFRTPELNNDDKSSVLVEVILIRRRHLAIFLLC